jgi:GNAT superfamily N-acetyltransferase
VKIREATGADVDAIVAMAVKFIDTTSYRAHLANEPDVLRALVAKVVDGPVAVVLVADGDAGPFAMIGLHVYEHPMSGEAVAQELCWWVEPDARGGRAAIRLMRAAEAWACAHGATVMQMVAPTERIAAFYGACGYDRVEVLYQRRL